MAGNKFVIPIVWKSDDRGIKEAEDGLTRLGNFATKAGFAMAAGLAVGAAAAVTFGVESLKAAANAEAITRGLENAAKNAAVFGDSSTSIKKATKALDEHSKKLGELTGIDDELINQLKTGWLAVPDLAKKGTDGINKLAEAAADIAKGTGKDISAVAMAFTKITGDSETALSKLNRIGIILSDQQKQTYDDILATNGEIAAQDYLLQSLGDKYKGAAEAAANPFERLNVIFENLKETIGAALLPAFEQAIPLIQEFIANLTSDPEFQAFLDGMGTALTNMLPQLESVLGNFNTLLIDILPGLTPALQILGDTLGILSSTLSATSDNSADLWRDLKNIAYIINQLNKLWSDLTTAMNDAGSGMGWLKPIIQSLLDALNPLGALLDKIVKLWQWNSEQKVITSGAGNYNGGIKLAEGGIVMPRPGGVQATIAEAGKPEAVIPLDKMGSMGTTVNIYGNVGYDAEELAREISRKQAQAFSLTGLSRVLGIA